MTGAVTLPKLPIAHRAGTYTCGKCQARVLARAGRWKHPVLGWCCAGCKR